MGKPGPYEEKGNIRRKASLPYWAHRRGVRVEINDSTDFNEYYRRDADPEDPFFSGGSFGSGRPAVVYKTVVDTEVSGKLYELELVGHSNPNGENGQLNPDIATLTTAKQIADNIVVVIK